MRRPALARDHRTGSAAGGALGHSSDFMTSPAVRRRSCARSRSTAPRRRVGRLVVGQMPALRGRDLAIGDARCGTRSARTPRSSSRCSFVRSSRPNSAGWPSGERLATSSSMLLRQHALEALGRERRREHEADVGRLVAEHQEGRALEVGPHPALDALLARHHRRRRETVQHREAAAADVLAEAARGRGRPRRRRPSRARSAAAPRASRARRRPRRASASAGARRAARCPAGA